jgi:DNA repair protein RecN (Recombination protein N)
MLVELRVRDLATIADVTLHLGTGLNVLTGETGAGKSMLVDALGLLLGGRAESGAVRPGASKAIVEGVVEVEAAGIRRRVEGLGLDLDEGRLVLRREVSAEGRSRAWANGSPTTAGVLQELGALLVDLHGQHEAQSLLRPDLQRDVLDAYAGAGTQADAVAAAHGEWASLAQRADELQRRRDDVQRRADYLRHVVSEIERLQPKADELEALIEEARLLGQAGARAEHAGRLAQLLDGGNQSALGAVAQAERVLGQLERLDPAAARWRELLDAAYANLRELAAEASAYADGAEEDPARLDEVQTRRDALQKLCAKHGGDLARVLAVRDEAAAELDLLDTADLDLRAIAARREAAQENLRTAAAGLTAARTAAAERLARAVNRLLPRLGLGGGEVVIRLQPVTEVGPAGAEQVTFDARLNIGMDARPIAKVASGGELARLMLAFKVVLARQDRIPTLVFDEVDEGVGGEIGGQVGAALAEVAQRHQVLVITHLPQIAARADRHLVVRKRAMGGVATSDVETIHGEDRVTELARMLGDADDAAARKHAESLLRRSADAAR